MSSRKIVKSGWNTKAALLGAFWYFNKRMYTRGFLLLLIYLCTVGIGIIPVHVYCGYKANSDFYHFLKKKNVYIY